MTNGTNREELSNVLEYAMEDLRTSRIERRRARIISKASEIEFIILGGGSIGTALSMHSHYSRSYNEASYSSEAVLALAVIGGMAMADHVFRLITDRGLLERAYSFGNHAIEKSRALYSGHRT